MSRRLALAIGGILTGAILVVAAALPEAFEVKPTAVGCENEKFQQLLKESTDQMLKSGYTETTVHRTVAVRWKYAVVLDPSREFVDRAYLEFDSGDHGRTLSRGEFAPLYLSDACSRQEIEILHDNEDFYYQIEGFLPVRILSEGAVITELRGEHWSSTIEYSISDVMGSVLDRLESEYKPQLAESTDVADVSTLTDEQLQGLSGLPRDAGYESIGVYEMWEKGFVGEGATVAVLELAGIENSNPIFEAKVIDSYCIISETFGETCPNGELRQSGVAASERRANDNDHGLAVSYPIIGNPGQNGPGAITPGARVFWLRAEGGFSSTQIALRKLIELKDKYNIVALTMSFTARASDWSPRNQFRGDCNEDTGLAPLRNSFRELREAGIMPFASAGNTPSSNSDLGYFPACFKEVVSVGTVDKQGQIAGYVTASEGMELLAPDWVNVVGDNGVSEGAGTSIATPVAAAAYAMLRSAYPEASPEEVLSAMKKTGRQVSDPFLSNKPAIDIAKAAEYLETGEFDSALQNPDFETTPETVVCSVRDVWITQVSLDGEPRVEIEAPVGCQPNVKLLVDSENRDIQWRDVRAAIDLESGPSLRIDLELYGEVSYSILNSVCLDRSFVFGSGNRKIEVASAKCGIFVADKTNWVVRQARPLERFVN